MGYRGEISDRIQKWLAVMVILVSISILVKGVAIIFVSGQVIIAHVVHLLLAAMLIGTGIPSTRQLHPAQTRTAFSWIKIFALLNILLGIFIASEGIPYLNSPLERELQTIMPILHIAYGGWLGYRRVN